MAGELREKILTYLAKRRQDVPLLMIMKDVNVSDGSHIEEILLELEKERFVSKSMNQPPKWKLTAAGKLLVGVSRENDHTVGDLQEPHEMFKNVAVDFHREDDNFMSSMGNDLGSAGLVGTSRPIGQHSVGNIRQSSLDDVEKKIMHLLSNKAQMFTSQIAKSLHFQKKQLNQQLYSMRRRGILEKVQVSPPMWAISRSGSQLNSDWQLRGGQQEAVCQGSPSVRNLGGQNRKMSDDPKLTQPSTSETKELWDSSVSGRDGDRSMKPYGHHPQVIPNAASTNQPISSLWQESNFCQRSRPPPNPEFLLKYDPQFRASQPSFSATVVRRMEEDPGSFWNGRDVDHDLVIDDCDQESSTMDASQSEGRSLASDIVPLEDKLVHTRISSCPRVVNTDFKPTLRVSSSAGSGQFCFGSSATPSSFQAASCSVPIKAEPTSVIPKTPAELLGMSEAEQETLASAVRRPVVQPDPCLSDVTLGSTASAGMLSNDAFAAINKNSVSALMEYAQARKLKASIEVLGQRGPPHNPRFTVAAFVGSRKFPTVESSNKKDGRKEAADVALRMLMAEGSYQETDMPSCVSLVRSGKGTHFDHIAAIAHSTYNQVAAHVAENMTGRKVMAALIMKRGPSDEGSVISLGTGNRSITGQFLSLAGQTVNDSHAEIITRRGFLRFLYKQLLEGQPGHPSSILEQCSRGMFRVKEGVTFHLYISTAPCGDGALFSPRDSHNTQMVCDDSHQKHQPIFASKVQGLLRTKMEGGEGTIPVESDFEPQTWDGIQRGERLRTMSCSDKLCCWNLVGMQGALLSHFIKPIYLDSVTLGFLYNHGHLSRALCCRLSHGNPDITQLLPPGYQINHPRLGRVTVCDPPREVQKTKEFSINWTVGDTKPEVLDGTKGICTGVSSLDDQISRLSKTSLYRHFKAVCKKYGQTPLLTCQTYKEAKTRAVDFQLAKQVMFSKLKAMGYGQWVKKPAEEQMFDVNN